ncbi:hypothetical protein A2533_00615 [Candidatus Falkowbacteria bacterium RIFOXYD2_FULL_35_9]|uniref:Uncharacterized protein n=1 Tax=Candidatus Falkowbacteria bacterium RIFOXYC2_FULL_36_12 TaxID=1798002 RepID=A0A1F5SWA2_9BACT|nr:MAG: hypothetical protein A2478_01065 [Candidatus Falkowbacteria bacterium RIFOXYC2_FULL_36_12]OGF31188.1 MAG: hypothetical protein A2300_02975 [Candidatus Falkowbacteria bacterium RIFOXYB2_FULL_35_7]OGF34443.1 MAG: hypothetical protein A2223_02865 [Candidatus Falkowbacteria bacterium RIFOXYA2_FULL_35_8]OGF47562.1 MAG: hypothetical protein A2533_00615 [Candidatus Falkowbacteria bacterium RIFOXYD2_FULL_35_9]
MSLNFFDPNSITSLHADCQKAVEAFYQKIFTHIVGLDRRHYQDNIYAFTNILFKICLRRNCNLISLHRGYNYKQRKSLEIYCMKQVRRKLESKLVTDGYNLDDALRIIAGTFKLQMALYVHFGLQVEDFSLIETGPIN